MSGAALLYVQPGCPDCETVRGWLRSEGIPFEELDVSASPPAAARAAEIGYGAASLPSVEAEGRALARPSALELAVLFGRPLPPVVEADCVVVGGGPAGLTAAMYLSRERVPTVVLESGTPGGQINTTTWVENYPGFPQGVEGPDLGAKLAHQARRFGAQLLHPVRVAGMRAAGERHEVLTGGGTVFRAPAVIAATGSDYRRLDVPGAAELVGRGVGYCATCDGPLFRNRTVAVVGGGNSAAEESLFLLRFVRELHIFQDLPALTAQKHLVEELLADPRVRLHVNSRILEVRPGPAGSVQCLRVQDKVSGEERCHEVQGVFVFIGRTPNTGWLSGYAELDRWGFVVARPGSVETARRGLYAAGDCRSGARAQITTAAGDGTLASFLVRELLRGR